MTATIHEVLGELRTASLDARDKGDEFERLVQAYLLNDPEWTAKFSDVWLWSEWQGRAGVTDIGINLVAANRDRDVEWIIDRYYVKTDKASGNVNDPNGRSREVGDPRYILDLLTRIVTVSVETMDIVDALPPLDIIDGA